MQSGKIYKNQGVRKDGTFTDTTDVTSAGFAAQVNAAVTAAEAKGGTSETGGEFTLGVDRDTGILTNEVNDGFIVPADQSKYLTSGNDVIDITEWTGIDQLTISDIFANDNDSVLAKFEILAGVGSNNLKLASIENLQIINSGNTNPLNLNGNNFKGLEAIKLIGEASNFSAAAFTYGIKVDATPNADSIIGSDKADTINGGAGNDTIVGNDGVDILTGGNGADTFVVGTVKAAGIDQILDFSAEDKIALKGFVPNELKKFDASTFSTVTYKTLDSVLATFIQGGANETKAGDIAIFTYDGKTYALLAKGAFDVYRDALIDITGTNVASLTESNFGDGAAVSQYNYANYTEFTNAIGSGVEIPAGEAIIKTMTTVEAGTLLGQDAKYLALVSEGGIKKITGKDPIAVQMANKAGASEFDASVFDSKLSPDVTDILMNISGTSANDTIIASKFGGIIDAGSGNDAITLGAGADTVVFSSKAAADANTITNFNVANDKLSFDATEFGGFSGAADKITEVSSATNVDTSSNTAIFRGTLNSLKTNLKASASGDSNKVVIAIATDVGNEGIYSVTLKHSGGASAQESEIVKVGTLDVVNLSTLTIDNFIAGV